ncbi:MAG: hypothetical protein RMJ44_10430 [Cytophagales bacterium]|nr:hypothetical protein [Bernardetiaceae bacterium]MDW8211491.1 hypothetical protein [Cytophagales bacterium]
MKFWVAVVAYFLFHLAAFCQSSVSNAKSSSGSEQRSIYMQQASKVRIFGIRFRKAAMHNPFVEARLKERRKIAEEMKKPQYSNKMYFGHKRPPKKRPVHKRKFCKVCGIVH